MSGLVEFLRARLDEDEATARVAGGLDWHVGYDGNTIGSGDGEDVAPVVWGQYVDHVARHDPARVLAEVEAKRRIADLAWHHFGEEDYAWGMEEAKRQILAELATVYADHPDYREEWRP